jgi:arrestin-related trafficking adapter 3/6
MHLAISFTEPVVFLRGDHSSPKRGILARNNSEPAPQAMVRGLLVLTLDKPTKISTIEVEIEGKCTSNWTDGTGSRGVENFEEHRILYADTTLFSAVEEERDRLTRSTTGSTHPTRRHASVGPGLSFDRSTPQLSDSDNSDGNDSDEENERGRDRTVNPRGRNSRGQPLSRLEDRHTSVDPYRQSRYPPIHTATVSTHPTEFPDCRTPPYTEIAPSPDELDQIRFDSVTNANTRANGEVLPDHGLTIDLTTELQQHSAL